MCKLRIVMRWMEFYTNNKTDCAAGEELIRKTDRAASKEELRRTDPAAGEEELRRTDPAVGEEELQRTDRAAGVKEFMKGLPTGGCTRGEKILWREERCNYYHRRFLMYMTEMVGLSMMKEKTINQSTSR